MADTLLITPPFTQLNTPYPGTAYLKGFLNTKNIASHQVDLGIEVILALFCKEGIQKLFDQTIIIQKTKSENAQRIFALRSHYVDIIDEVIGFLQGKNQSLARQICSEGFLPEASRFSQLDDLDWAFGTMGFQDKAKHLATLFLEDISDYIVECVDDQFGFSRYAERLGRCANSFDDLHLSLINQETYIDKITLSILESKIQRQIPKLICFSVPFPGNLYSAFRCAKYIKMKYPSIKTAMGGGFPNTELRDIKDTRVFDYFDFITLDDGELPIELLISNVLNNHESNADYRMFKRTFLKENEQVFYNNFSLRRDYKHSETGTPDYSDLLLDRYISVMEIANPMHSMWSDGRWNKLTMAHGCYWGKCTFCDVTLDYIKNYEPLAAILLVDRMEEMINQTGEASFHFVDEAAPPALMREVAIEILKRKIVATWWTNIRFEKSFTADLCRLLKESGCIAVSGGLEVASDRLLSLIKKGVTVEQVAQVTRNFTEAGIMVHAYLMYGYPTQTVQETVDSLEMVRQMFEQGLLQSGFWHQFAMTAHSPVGMKPDEYGVVPQYNDIKFANNDVSFKDTTGIDHSLFSYGLKKSLFNFVHGLGMDFPLQDWFDFKIPKTQIKKDYIASCIDDDGIQLAQANSKIIWIGNMPITKYVQVKKKGKIEEKVEYLVHTKNDTITFQIDKLYHNWLIEMISKIAIQHGGNVDLYANVKSDFEDKFNDSFEVFWYGKAFEKMKEAGLLIL